MKIKKLLISALIILMAIMTACSGEKKDADAEKITQATEDFFSAIKACDFEKVKSVSVWVTPRIEGEENPPREDDDIPTEEADIKLFEKLLKNLSWKIGDVKVDGDSATVDIEITNKKVNEAFQQALISVYVESQQKQVQMESDEVMKRVYELMDETLESVESFTVKVVGELDKDNEGNWKLFRSGDVMAAVYGSEKNPDAPEGTEPENPAENKEEPKASEDSADGKQESKTPQAPEGDESTDEK